MRIALLGYGRFGKALASLLRQAGHTLRVHDPHAAAPASEAAPSLTRAIVDAAWIIIAVPVAALAPVVHDLRPMLADGQTVIDVCSVKQHPGALLDDAFDASIPHAGTHPLFGPLSLGRGERPLRVVLCASAQHPAAAERTRELFESLGCEVLPCDPVTHDQMMARTHALAFFIAKALVDMGIGEDLSMAPPSFLGLANMLAAVRGDAGHLFATIERENPHAATARAEFIAQLDSIHQRLGADGGSALSIPGPPRAG